VCFSVYVVVKVCLIVVDSLRFDVAYRLANIVMDVAWNFKFYECWSLANTTEPSLATLLTGLRPEEHGIVRTGMPNAEKLLDRVRGRLLTNYFKCSLIASPAVIFHKYFTYSYVAKYVEEIVLIAKNYIDKCDFMLLHIMDVHDLIDRGWGVKWYFGYEPIPKHVLEWKPPSGLPRPYETEFRVGDAGLLKAKYYGAVERVFTTLRDLLTQLVSKDYTILLTSDHGESFNFWHHDGVYEEDVFKVPLITNVEFSKAKVNHLDIYKKIVELAVSQS